MRFAPHLRDMPKMRASSRSTSEGSASPRMAENSRARKSTVQASQGARRGGQGVGGDAREAGLRGDLR